MFLKIKATLWPGDADGGYAAFTRRCDDSDYSVVLAIRGRLFFHRFCALGSLDLRILLSLEKEVIQKRKQGETCPV